jgi:hypothetical protein
VGGKNEIIHCLTVKFEYETYNFLASFKIMIM